MGGAKNCPETPRQKMIGMMYLVLTAMLALNVSTDILKAFKLVDDSLHTTLSTTDSRNKVLMDEFRGLRDDNPEKNGAWYDKAVEMTQRSDSLFNYIQDTKYQIAVKADGAKKADPEARVISANDNREAAANYALPNVGEQPAVVLKNMINEYREYLISLDPSRKEEFDAKFSTEDVMQKDGDMLSWENQMFHDMPAGAAVVLMTKIQNDVRNAELEMIQYLRKQTDAGDLRVNKFDAHVIPNSRTVIRGSKYSAKIIMAAIDSTQTPEYYVEGQRINDQGLYEVVASSEGLKKFSGYIAFLNPATGEVENLNFESEYSVIPPTMTISNTELNVLYRDHDNALSVSVPGVTQDKLRVSVSGGSVRQGGGLWVIRPSDNAKEVVINVTAEIDGKMQALTPAKYRIKDMPKPAAYFRASDGTQYNAERAVPRNILQNPNGSIIASYGPDDLLDVPFQVVSFKARIGGQLSESNGNKFTKEQRDRIGRLDRNSVIVIQDIKAKSEGGSKLVPLSSIPITMQ